MNAVSTLPVAEHRTRSSTKHVRNAPSLKPIRKKIGAPAAKSAAAKTIIVKAPKLAARSTKPASTRKPKANRRTDKAHVEASAAEPLAGLNRSPLVTQTHYVVITNKDGSRVAWTDNDRPRCEKYAADFTKGMEPDSHRATAEVVSVDVALPVGGVAAPSPSPQAVDRQAVVNVEMYALVIEGENGETWIDNVAVPNCTEKELDDLHEEADLYNRNARDGVSGSTNYKRAAVVALVGQFPFPQQVKRPVVQFDLNCKQFGLQLDPNYGRGGNAQFEAATK